MWIRFSHADRCNKYNTPIHSHCIILLCVLSDIIALSSISPTDVLPTTSWENTTPVPYTVFSVNVGTESADVEKAFDFVAEFRERHFIVACHMDCVKEVFRQVCRMNEWNISFNVINWHSVIYQNNIKVQMLYWELNKTGP